MNELNGEKDYFEDSLVGQFAARKKLSFIISNYYSTGYFSPTALVCARGMGKTTGIEKIARLLYLKGTKIIKPFLPINAAEITDVDYFFTYIVPSIIDKEITLAVDEIAALPTDVKTMLLSVLNITDKNITEFNYKGDVFKFDLTKLSFLCSTTHLNQIPEPLQDRLNIVQFTAFQIDELAQILINNLKGFKLNKDLAADVVEHTKQTPRDIQKIGKDIRGYLTRKNKTYFSEDDWKECVKQLSINKFGLEPLEIEILKAISKAPKSLTSLSSFLCLDRSTVQRGHEPYLLRRGLLAIENGKRSLSLQGRLYLENYH